MQDGPLRAGDLAGRLAHISRPAVSKHLRVLRNSELVTQTQQGRERWYQLNPEPLLQVLKWVAQYEIFWEEKLLKLKEIVEEDGN